MRWRAPCHKEAPRSPARRCAEPIARGYGDGAGLPVTFLYLRGRRETLLERMTQRTGHVKPASLLERQLATLEEPDPDESAVAVDIEQGPEAIVDALLNGSERKGTWD